MVKRLPSLSSLRAFEAAARHLSFTRAASELNVTQTAVSHQIRALERLVGVGLFSRTSSGIRVTDPGNEYLQAIRPALSQISQATTQAGYSQNRNILRIASLGTFAVKCLIPKLPHFRAKNPKLSIHITTIRSFDDLLQRDYDVEVRYGNGQWPHACIDRLSHEEVFPVCSPQLLNSKPLLRTPDDLRSYTIIRTESKVLRDIWEPWLRAAGVKNLKFSDQIICNSIATTIQAASDGLGVALARSSLTKEDLASGRLVEPFGMRLPCPDEGYFLVTSPKLAESRKVRAFRDWMLESFLR